MFFPSIRKYDWRQSNDRRSTPKLVHCFRHKFTRYFVSLILSFIYVSIVRSSSIEWTFHRRFWMSLALKGLKRPKTPSKLSWSIQKRCTVVTLIGQERLKRSRRNAVTPWNEKRKTFMVGHVHVWKKHRINEFQIEN